MDHERIIHILDYLSRHTDESHFVTINQIQDYLANVCNLSRVKSVTIRRDLDRLTTMGNNIIKVNHEHNTAYYPSKRDRIIKYYLDNCAFSANRCSVSIDIALKLSVSLALSSSTYCYGEKEKSCGAEFAHTAFTKK